MKTAVGSYCDAERMLQAGTQSLLKMFDEIAATSPDLKQRVVEGKFRSDLYCRLNVLPVTLPPLRDRLADLDVLCQQLLEQIVIRTEVRRTDPFGTCIPCFLSLAEERARVE